MSTKTREQIGLDITSTITSNAPNQAITGELLRILTADTADSSLFLADRFDVYFYSKAVEYKQTAAPLPHVIDDKRYIYNWSGATEPINASVHVGDIVKWDGSEWVLSTEYNSNISRDIVVYCKATSTIVPTPASLYKDGLSYSVPLNANVNLWKEAGIMTMAHGTLIGLLGAGPEYNHVNDAQLDIINNSYNTKLRFLGDKVKMVGTKTSPAVSGDIVIYGEAVIVYNGSSWDPYDISWNTALPGYTPPQYNYIALSEDNNHTWIFDYKNNTWNDMGVNIHVNHNSGHGIQGGNGVDEFYHLTLAAKNIAERAITRVKYFGENSVIEFIGNAAPPTTGSNLNDRVLTDSGVYKCTGTVVPNSWTPEIVTTDNKEYWFVATGNGKTYISNADNSSFTEVNKGVVLDHDSQVNKKGDGPEYNHVNDDQLTMIQAMTLPVLNQTIYVDPTNGNDNNTGAAWPIAVKTVAGIVNVMEGKNIYIHILQGGNLTIDSTVIDKAKSINAAYISLIGYLGNEEQNVALTQHSLSQQLYKFDASIVGTSYESDLATGKLFYGNYPMRGTNIVKETSTNGIVVINKHIGATASDNITSLTSVLSVSAYDESLEILIEVNNLEVVLPTNVLGVLGNRNKLTNSIVRTNELSADMELINSTIKPNISGTDIVINGKVIYDDLMLSAPATSASGMISGNVVVNGEFIGKSLTLYGFETPLKGGKNSIISVGNFLTVTGFKYLIDPTNGGEYNLSNDHLLIGYTDSISTNACNLLHANPLGLTYNNDLYINTLGFITADTTVFSYKDLTAAHNLLFYKRDTSSVKILHSFIEEERSDYLEEFTSDGTDHVVAVSNDNSSKMAAVDVSIFNKTDSKYYKFSLDISDTAPKTVILDGGTDAGSGDSSIISGVTYASGSLTFSGFVNAKDYLLQMDVKRFFS